MGTPSSRTTTVATSSTAASTKPTPFIDCDEAANAGAIQAKKTKGCTAMAATTPPQIRRIF